MDCPYPYPVYLAYQALNRNAVTVLQTDLADNRRHGIPTSERVTDRVWPDQDPRVTTSAGRLTKGTDLIPPFSPRRPLQQAYAGGLHSQASGNLGLSHGHAHACGKSSPNQAYRLMQLQAAVGHN